MSNYNSKIDAIICAYNSEAFLTDAIKSVFRQTLQPAEIVVIDDGSTDNTAGIAQSYANSGLRYVKQNNEGEGAARNRGIRETQSEWIAFLDADDIWLDDKLQRQFDFVQTHPEVGMVGGDKLWWDVKENTHSLIKYGRVPSDRLYKELIISNVVGDPSIMLIRRVLFERAGLFRTDLRIGVDWEMWLRIAKHTTIGFIESPLITYRWHSSNVSNRFTNHRVKTMESISLDAIRLYKNPVTRIELYFRMKSRSQVELTLDSIQVHASKLKQFQHALFAFLLYPFENSGKKIRLILQSLLSERLYITLKSKLQRAEERTFG